jgi:hypothetical protein
VQTEDPELEEKAQRIAQDLSMPLEIRYTGYGLLEKQLVSRMNGAVRTE